jgi:bla regulator protein BlaR1
MIGEWTNHLWQSTLFAVVAAILTLAFRKNRAQVRYWLWLSASFKFLVPFAPLMTLGNNLWAAMVARHVAKGIAPPTVSLTMVLIAQLFPNTLSFASSIPHAISFAIFLVWGCGFVNMAFLRFRGWLRIRAAVLTSAPIAIPAPVEIRSSACLLEPGIVGFLRPILLLPDGILKTLTPPQLEAVLEHEICHLRRRDNATAAIHMIVEAVFWFHPLVWWIGARLVEERERACDEAVLESGASRRIYAESIVKICELCVGSPLACVPGVTSADLKKRIVRIMTETAIHKLGLGRKLLLGTAGLVAIAAPIAFGLLRPTPSRAASQTQNAAAATPVFDVVSIKPDNSATESMKTGKGIIRQRMMINPGELTATGNTLKELIHFFYGVEDFQISGGPSWLNSEVYDVDAKADQSVRDALNKLSVEQRTLVNQRMLQALLADRFKLVLHRETRDLPEYSLVVTDAGKLHEVQGDCPPNSNLLPPWEPGKPLPPPPCGGLGIGAGGFDGLKVPIPELVRVLSGITRRIVLDKTGLTGKYDINLEWAAEPGQRPSLPPTPLPQPDPTRLPLPMAIQQQLGLKLEAQTAPVEILVIDQAERPVQN